MTRTELGGFLLLDLFSLQKYFSPLLGVGGNRPPLWIRHESSALTVTPPGHTA